jgi:hypothetical protein
VGEEVYLHTDVSTSRQRRRDPGKGEELKCTSVQGLSGDITYSSHEINDFI